MDSKSVISWGAASGAFEGAAANTVAHDLMILAAFALAYVLSERSARKFISAGKQLQQRG